MGVQGEGCFPAVRAVAKADEGGSPGGTRRGEKKRKKKKLVAVVGMGVQRNQ